jgi:hypothetical protein
MGHRRSSLVAGMLAAGYQPPPDGEPDRGCDRSGHRPPRC